MIEELASITEEMPDPSESGAGLFSSRIFERARYHNTGCDQGFQFFFNAGFPLGRNHRATDGCKRIMDAEQMLWFLKFHVISEEAL